MSLNPSFVIVCFPEEASLNAMFYAEIRVHLLSLEAHVVCYVPSLKSSSYQTSPVYPFDCVQDFIID